MTGDRLLIGFDKSNGNDKTCLVVMRHRGRGFEIVNRFTDTEATELYERLTEKRKTEKRKQKHYGRETSVMMIDEIGRE